MMSAPKKAAKKAPAKHDEAKDARRAHEHAERLNVLMPLLGKDSDDVETLVKLASHELATSHPKDAADLFRAAEHLCFGLLAPSDKNANTDSALSESVTKEFENKLEKAEEQWDNSDVLGGIYQKAVDGAREALAAEAYARALELVRAAEAIAHVHLHEQQ